MIQPALRTLSRALAIAVVGVALPAVVAPTAADAAGTSPIVISQLRAQGAGGDFVELQNVSGSAVTLAGPDGWALALRANDGSPLCDAVGPGGAFDLTLNPGQHYLFGGASYSATGVHAADSTFVAHTGTGTACTTALADDAGGVVLTDAAKSVADAVAYGSAAAAGTEGFTSLDPSDGSAIRRKVNGTQDTDSNTNDFEQVTADPQGLDPVVDTTAATSVTGTTGTLNGTIDAMGQTVTACSFDIGTDTSYSLPAVACSSVPAGAGAVPFSGAATGLQPATTYHFRSEITEAGGTYAGPDQQFTTPAPPTGATGAADLIDATSATVHGTLNPHGVTLSDCHFDYGTSTGYGSTTPCATKPTGSLDSAVSAALTGLTATTTYYYRLVATSAGGTLTASGSSFTTPALPPVGPTVVTGATPTTFLTGANLTGTANPKGLKVTNCHFEYGLTTAYGTNAACVRIPSGADPITVSQSIAGLKPGTTYHYRLVATSSSGTGYGDDVAFTTKGQVTDSVQLPDTTLLPPVLHRAKHTITFTFKARNVTGTPQFQCALVKLPTKKGVKAPAPKFTACATPKTTKKLTKGRYRFYVRAVGAAGKDPTPASRTFAI